MQRITLLCVGGLKSSWLQEGCAQYAARLFRLCNFEVVEIAPSKAKDAMRQREEETTALLERLKQSNGDIWALDERGTQWTSPAFSKEVARLRDAGTPLTFVLGGAYGFDDRMHKRTDRLLALSKLTLPHELCRLLFLEQLYRAHEIARGSGYHHV